MRQSCYHRGRSRTPPRRRSRFDSGREDRYSSASRRSRRRSRFSHSRSRSRSPRRSTRDYGRRVRDDYHHRDRDRQRERGRDRRSHERERDYYRRERSPPRDTAPSIPLPDSGIKPIRPRADFILQQFQNITLCNEVLFTDYLRTSDLAKNLCLHHSWSPVTFIHSLVYALSVRNSATAKHERMRLFLVWDYFMDSDSLGAELRHSTSSTPLSSSSKGLKGAETGPLLVRVNMFQKQLADVCGDCMHLIIRYVFPDDCGSLEDVLKVRGICQKWKHKHGERKSMTDTLLFLQSVERNSRVNATTAFGSVAVASTMRTSASLALASGSDDIETKTPSAKVVEALEERHIKLHYLNSPSKVQEIANYIEKQRRNQRRERMGAQLLNPSVDEFELYWNTVYPRWKLVEKHTRSPLLWDWRHAKMSQ